MEQSSEGVSTSPGRRFGMGDGLIVLAGIAVTFSILWDTPGLYQHLLVAIFSDGNWASDQFFRNWHQLIQGFSPLLSLLLCLTSATVVVLNLKQPRPPLEILAGRPGFMASATVMVLLIPGALLAVKSLVIARIAFSANGGYGVLFTDPRFLLTYFLGMMPIPTAMAILASWFTLIVNRRWNPQPTWLDRAGRFVGMAWLLLAIL